MSKPNDLARSSPGSLAAALSGCRHFLPVIAVLNPVLGTILAMLDAGLNVAADIDADYLRNDIEALRRLVGRVEDRVMNRFEWTEERARELLRRPDVLKLLAEARDDYALAQYESRLNRFADVVAERAPRAEEDIQRDLHLARAALKLDDLTVAFLRTLPFRHDRTGHHFALSSQPRTSTTTESPATWLKDRRDARAHAGIGLAFQAGIEVATVEGLITRIVGNGNTAHTLTFEDGSIAYVDASGFGLTLWGIAFVEAIEKRAQV